MLSDSATPSLSSPFAADPIKARRRLWLTVAIMLVAVFIGGGWDQVWHLTHPFDGFFSPPHVFVYACCLLAAVCVFVMVMTPRIRKAFGPGFVVLGLPLPGALFLLGGGIALAGLAGLVFDNLWHTNFGLDETLWSFPHAMIGWAELLFTLGVIACRLALRPNLPLHWYTVLFLGLLLLLASAVPVMGPLIANRSLPILQAQSHISVLAAQPPAQHAFRIYAAWNLTRANPLLIVLAALWSGAALAFLRRLDHRAWLLLLIVALWTWLDTAQSQAQQLERYVPGLSAHPANWLPLPLFAPTIVVLVLPMMRVSMRWTWGIAGLVLGYLTWGIFAMPPAALFLVIVAAPVMLLGKFVGERVYAAVEQPGWWASTLTLMLTGVAVPLITGMVDLALRAATP